jgi:hypothetical protein
MNILKDSVFSFSNSGLWERKKNWGKVQHFYKLYNYCQSCQVPTVTRCVPGIAISRFLFYLGICSISQKVLNQNLTLKTLLE